MPSILRVITCPATLGIRPSDLINAHAWSHSYNAYVCNLISSGQPKSAADAMTQASSIGTTGTSANATAVATAASTVSYLLVGQATVHM